MKKMNFLAIITLAFLLSSNLAIAQQSEPITIISVSSTTSSPSVIRAGDTFTHSISLINTAYEISAKDVEVTIDTSSAFEIVGNAIQNAKTMLKGETRTFIFNLKVNENVTAGDYTVSYRINYSRGDFDRSETRNATITVSDIYRLDIQNVKTAPLTPHIEEPIKIQATILNTGTNLTRNTITKISLSTDGNFGQFITVSDNQVELGNLAPGESKNVEFVVIPSRKTGPGIYSFELDANCFDCTDRSKETVNVEVFGKPDMFISGIDYSVEGKDIKKIIQGDLFSISVQIDNIGEEKANAVTITAGAFEGLNGSNKTYIGTIDPDDSGAGVFDYAVSSTAKTGEHTINFEIKYLDELDNEQTFSDSFSIFVEEAPAPGIEGTLILIIIILVVLYFLIKLVLRQLALRKMSD